MKISVKLLVEERYLQLKIKPFKGKKNADRDWKYVNLYNIQQLKWRRMHPAPQGSELPTHIKDRKTDLVPIRKESQNFIQRQIKIVAVWKSYRFKNTVRGLLEAGIFVPKRFLCLLSI